MSQIIVQKLNGLKVITPFLKSNKVNLQRNSVALVRNLSRNPNLHNSLGKHKCSEAKTCLLPVHSTIMHLKY